MSRLIDVQIKTKHCQNKGNDELKHIKERQNVKFISDFVFVNVLIYLSIKSIDGSSKLPYD